MISGHHGSKALNHIEPKFQEIDALQSLRVYSQREGYPEADLFPFEFTGFI